MASRRRSAKRVAFEIADGNGVIGSSDEANVKFEAVDEVLHGNEAPLLEVLSSTTSSTVASSVRSTRFSIGEWEAAWINSVILEHLDARYERVIRLADGIKASLTGALAAVTACLPKRRGERIIPFAKVEVKDELPKLPSARSIFIYATKSSDVTFEAIKEQIHVITDNVILKLSFEKPLLKALMRLHDLCNLNVPRLAIHVGFDDVSQQYERFHIWRHLLVGDIIVLSQVIADGMKGAPSEHRFFILTFLWNSKQARDGKHLVVDKLRRRKISCIVTNEDRNEYRFRIILKNCGHVQLEIVLKSKEQCDMVV
uniref:Helicase C-terminal domain-containing protein n=1 Tax=Panagrellus redivivus TaxID=6233 RepID=A0A7E4V386_PANRE